MKLKDLDKINLEIYIIDRFSVCISRRPVGSIIKKWNKAASEAEEIFTKHGETLRYERVDKEKDEGSEVFLPTGKLIGKPPG